MLQKILIVEDDKSLQSYLKELLLDNEYNVSLAGDGPVALEMLKKSAPDLVVLDLGLPTMNGETVMVNIRKNYPELPVLILTAKDSVSDIVSGLSLGADDYITKPFNADEFLARIKARLRSKGGFKKILTAGDLELNKETLEVSRSRKKIQLTPKEYELLNYLLSNKGRILSREMILSRVWMYSSDIDTRVVDVYMGYLRKKVDSKHSKKLLQSVRGFGYMIKD